MLKKLRRRARWWAVLPVPLLVIAVNSFGPDGWREPAARLLWLSWATVALALTHFARKALHDYADGEQAWRKSLESPLGAGLSFLGLCVLGAALFLGLSSFARAQDVRSFVPERAQQLAPLVRSEIDRTWPALHLRSYIGGLVEQETCVTLKHRFCWSPSARLKTSREEGAGLGQFTRAWSADGRLRFDALGEVRTMAPNELQALDWQTIYTRADLGVRAVLVKLRDCDRRMRRQTAADAANRLAFCDAAYNGGLGGLATDRRLCAMATGCDPQQWFGHVEHHSAKSRAKWQGYGKSAFDINREHVDMALRVRRPKYVALLEPA